MPHRHSMIGVTILTFMHLDSLSGHGSYHPSTKELVMNILKYGAEVMPWTTLDLGGPYQELIAAAQI